MKSNAAELLSRIGAANPMQVSFVGRAFEQLRPAERDLLENYLVFLTSRGLSLDYLAECYDTIVKDMVREQMFFKRHGKYRHASRSDVADSVYYNDPYMEKYMYGLALTSFLWPNHIQLNRFFEDVLPRERTGSYLEVGPGHGLHFVTAMQACRFATYHAIDLSPTSIELTTALVESGLFGDFTQYRVTCEDFLEGAFKEDHYDAVVMGEILEHVDCPGEFLRRAAVVSRPGAFVYVTTVMNAAAIDHIALFESADEVFQLAKDSGFAVQDSLVLPYTGKTVEESEAERLPMNMAMVLTKI